MYDVLFICSREHESAKWMLWVEFRLLPAFTNKVLLGQYADWFTNLFPAVFVLFDSRGPAEYLLNEDGLDWFWSLSSF